MVVQATSALLASVQPSRAVTLFLTHARTAWKRRPLEHQRATGTCASQSQTDAQTNELRNRKRNRNRINHPSQETKSSRKHEQAHSATSQSLPHFSASRTKSATTFRTKMYSFFLDTDVGHEVNSRQQFCGDGQNLKKKIACGKVPGTPSGSLQTEGATQEWWNNMLEQQEGRNNDQQLKHVHRNVRVPNQKATFLTKTAEIHDIRCDTQLLESVSFEFSWISSFVVFVLSFLQPECYRSLLN